MSKYYEASFFVTTPEQFYYYFPKGCPEHAISCAEWGEYFSKVARDNGLVLERLGKGTQQYNDRLKFVVEMQEFSADFYQKSRSNMLLMYEPPIKTRWDKIKDFISSIF